ncbi:hypothetical protein RFI_08768 [Reticulomyxa filosa]|uniref:Rab3 GTPase-activating protein catalytic subunit n=1 Tax=Reticulomyxa filosa TaxID=46433 RepID=X6NR43_RETFI|nr:hypothetical protein RFI_08768 [Reticulomyxa filosa]|eukprot:ETO28363.1 hypothetical protein RFI_08768 [Reticulomyxa filosa]
MRAEGNLWQRVWNDSQPLPAMEQEVLYDFDTNGNEIIKWLCNLQPKYVLNEICQIALGNVLSIFERTPGLDRSVQGLLLQHQDLVNHCRSFWIDPRLDQTDQINSANQTDQINPQISSEHEPHDNKSPLPSPSAPFSSPSFSSPASSSPTFTQPYLDLQKTLDWCQELRWAEMNFSCAAALTFLFPSAQCQNLLEKLILPPYHCAQVFLYLFHLCVNEDEKQAVLKIVGTRKKIKDLQSPPLSSDDTSSDDDSGNDNENLQKKHSSQKSDKSNLTKERPKSVYQLGKPQSKEFSIVSSLPRPHPHSPATPNRMYVKISEYGFRFALATVTKNDSKNVEKKKRRAREQTNKKIEEIESSKMKFLAFLFAKLCAQNCKYKTLLY